MADIDSRFMAKIDCLGAEWRALVHEFGWLIVRDMRLDGHRDVEKLRRELEGWRARRQQQWLDEVPYSRMKAKGNAGDRP